MLFGQDSNAQFIARVETPSQVDMTRQQKYQKPDSTQLHNKSSYLYTYTNTRLGLHMPMTLANFHKGRNNWSINNVYASLPLSPFPNFTL